jgi:hypothetical protein
MKNWLKVLLITTGSIITAVLIVVAVMLWVVFTPSRITPFIEKQLKSQLNCEYGISDIELTFFSTFPRFGIRTGPFFLINPLPGTPNDTVLSASQMLASIDFNAFWKNREIILHEINLENPSLLLYYDADGNANFDVMVPDNEPDTTDFQFPLALLDIQKVKLNDARIVYADAGMDMVVRLNDVQASLTSTLKKDMIQGKMNIEASRFSFYWDSVNYVIDRKFELKSPYRFGINSQQLTMTNSDLKLMEMPFSMNLMVQVLSDSKEIITDILFASEQLQIVDVMELMQLPFSEYLEGISMQGKMLASGSIKGTMGPNSQPHFLLNLKATDSKFAYESLPYKLHSLSAEALVDIDLADEKKWNIRVDQFSAKTGKSQLAGKAFIDQLMGDMRFDVQARLNLDLQDATPMLPEGMPVKLQGRAAGNLNVGFLYSQFMADRYDLMKVSGTMDVKQLKAKYDTISMESPQAKLNFSWPVKRTGDFMNLIVSSPKLTVTMGSTTKAGFEDLSLNAFSSNFLHEKMSRLKVRADFAAGEVTAAQDSMSLLIVNPQGKAGYGQSQQAQINFEYQSDKTLASMGLQQFIAGNMQVKTMINRDMNQQDVLLHWIPQGMINLKDGRLLAHGKMPEMRMPELDLNFSRDEFNIFESKVFLGKSDFALKGKVSNYRDYLKKNGDLRAEFDFISGFTDANQLMSLTSGLGAENEEADKQATGTTSGPFMVPKGIDVLLRTHIDGAVFAKDTLRDIQGTLAVKDGNLLLESMLFTASAAKMQLTGLYQTPRRNHIFMGLDFHLMDVEIEELLAMIPDVDTIMPMLRSFAGRGEFHMAVETYVDSAYNLKKSTLRGTSSLRGEDLVLMDGETFTEIANKLRFSKKAKNKVDSISAEFSIFRNEVDIYPFMVAMDRYKAVVSGRHNLDMSFDYHISLVESPLPIQLGVDVKGTLDNLKILPVACKYPNLYRPARRNELENKQLEIRRRVREALLEKVKQ